MVLAVPRPASWFEPNDANNNNYLNKKNHFGVLKAGNFNFGQLKHLSGIVKF